MCLSQVHTKDYIQHFNDGTLSEAAVRRIGFGEVTRQPVLIQRTKSEVAGTVGAPPAVSACHPLHAAVLVTLHAHHCWFRLS